MTQNTYEEKAQTYLDRIEDAMSKMFQRYSWSRFQKPLGYALHGGKRLRPLILLLSTEATGGSVENALEAAIAVELLHTESIIHDDIIDEQSSRREKEAFHIKYGHGTSLLTADFVFGIILDIAARYQDPRIAKELSSAALKMCEGEFVEIKVNPINHRMKWNEYIDLISLKTASLFEVSARLGALLGKINSHESFTQYGLSLGMAYQIQDDAVDWGDGDKISEVLELEQKVDPQEHLREMCQKYAQQAKQSLSKIPKSEAKDHLFDLADLVVEKSGQVS